MAVQDQPVRLGRKRCLLGVYESLQRIEDENKQDEGEVNEWAIKSTDGQKVKVISNVEYGTVCPSGLKRKMDAKVDGCVLEMTLATIMPGGYLERCAPSP